jgi:hypothetical protein
MKYELKRIEIWSIIRIVFMISLVIGFVLSLFYASLLQFLGLFMNTIGGQDFNQMIPLGGIMTGFVLLFGTFGIAIIYTLIAAIAIFMYNVMAGWAGGIVLHLKSIDVEHQPEIVQTREESRS